MANFPTLRPATVKITPGVVPTTVQVGYDGSTVTSTADLVAGGDILTMTFEGLTETEARSVPDHQLAQQGRSFLFDSATLTTAETPPGFRWTYARAVSQRDIYAVAGSEFYGIAVEFIGVWIRRASTPSASARLVLTTTAALALPEGTPSASATLLLSTTPAGMDTGTPSQRALLILMTTAANAVAVPPPTVLVFTATSATNVPVPDSTANPRPMQLNPAGGAMNTGVTPNERNFIYTGLTCSNASAGNWRPVSQSTSTANEQRFDYYFNTATSSSTGGGSGTATVHNWSNRFDLKFGSFYLDGTAPFCGSANAVALLSPTSTAEATFISEGSASTPGNVIAGNQNSLTSSTYGIVFGASGRTGTLQFTAYTNVETSPLSSVSGGIITLTIDN
jgi:hypothetical protein